MRNQSYCRNARRARDRAWQSSNDSPISFTLSGSGHRLPIAKATTWPGSSWARMNKTFFQSLKIIERTSFDEKSSIESIVNSTEHSCLIIGSIIFYKICHCIGDFFVFIRRDHRSTGGDLQISPKDIRFCLRYLLVRAVFSLMLPMRVVLLVVLHRRLYRHRHPKSWSVHSR